MKPRFFFYSRSKPYEEELFLPRDQNRATSSEKSWLQMQIMQWDIENFSLPSWAGPKLDISHIVPCFFFFFFFSLVFLLSWAGLRDSSSWARFDESLNVKFNSSNTNRLDLLSNNIFKKTLSLVSTSDGGWFVALLLSTTTSHISILLWLWFQLLQSISPHSPQPEFSNDFRCWT